MKRSRFVIDFGRQVRAVRVRQGLSQEELASRAKLHQVSISLIEGGKRSATLGTIEKLARAMRVPPTALIPELRD